MERLDELHGFLRQSVISQKNVIRLETLTSHGNHQVADLSDLILQIARACPGKRNRWVKLAREQRPLFDRAVKLLGAEFYEEMLAMNGDFESPLWRVLERHR